MSSHNAGPPPRRQRVAAYAVLLRVAAAGTEVLLTRTAPHIGFQGWTLPGGGIDHGEDPRDAVRREVYEETGLHAVPGRVLEVYSHHFTGARPDGLVEDYHGIGLIFAAQLEERSHGVEPQVLDVGGSADLATWFPTGEARDLSLSGAARLALGLLDDEPGASEAELSRF